MLLLCTSFNVTIVYDCTSFNVTITIVGDPAGFVLAEAPAHASKDELLLLAADRDGWRREVLRIDPSLVSHSGRLGKMRIAAPKDLSAEEWFEGAIRDQDGRSSQWRACKMGPRNNKSRSRKIAKKATMIPLISP